MGADCHAVTAPNTMWGFCPSMPAAYLLTVAFGLTTIAHLTQAIFYRKVYCWVIFMSGAWQTISYAFRILSIENPASVTDYAVWFVLILVAPLWTNAFVYMVMGRMVWNYIPDAKICKVTAWRFGLYFVVLDISAFIVQIYGAAGATVNNVPDDQILRALHIYMFGVGFQQAFVLVFCFFAFQFHRTLLRSHSLHYNSHALQLLYTLYFILALITVRIIFRLCEYSKGLKSTVPNHEIYQYLLDSLPMLLALILLNIVHPGRIMPGKVSDIPSRKERKRNNFTSKTDHNAFQPIGQLDTFSV